MAFVAQGKCNGTSRQRTVKGPANPAEFQPGQQHGKLHQRQPHWCIARHGFQPWIAVRKPVTHQHCGGTCNDYEQPYQGQRTLCRGDQPDCPDCPAATGQQQQPQPAPPQCKAIQPGKENAEIEQQRRYIIRPEPGDPWCCKTADQTHERSWRAVAQCQREGEDCRCDQ